MNILTVCSKGLVRSVAMADVLKLHFDSNFGPVDVIPLGIDSNQVSTFSDLMKRWAHLVIVMDEPYVKRIAVIPKSLYTTVTLGPVGSDVWHNAQHPDLIAKCWDWLREHAEELDLKEHTRSL